MRSLFLLGLVCFAVFFTVGKAHAAWDPFGSQSFACPMETPAKIAGQSMGDMINKYFHIATSETAGGTLFKAGFFLALLVAIVRFAFGEMEGFKDFLKYLVIAAMLVYPLPTQGKSLMILLADTGDSLFQNIVQKIGGLDPAIVGGGSGAVSAFQASLAEAAALEKNDLNTFNTQCLAPAIRDYQLHNNAYPDGVNDPKLQPFYDGNYVHAQDTSPTFWGQAENNPLTGTLTCAQLKDGITAHLQTDYANSFRQYSNFLHEDGAVSADMEKLLNQYSNIPGDQLFADASQQAQLSPPQKEGNGGLVDFFANLTQKGALPGFVGRSVATSYFRLFVVLIGEFFVLVFDYYIYNIVAVIKIFAAIGMAIGILYYMWFKKLDLPLAALGAWMSANGLYVVAAIALRAFYDRAEYGEGERAASLLGLKNSLTDALFTIAIIGIMSTSLASMLSWKGIALAIHSFGGPRLPKPPMPKGGGSAGGGAGAGTTK